MYWDKKADTPEDDDAAKTNPVEDKKYYKKFSAVSEEFMCRSTKVKPRTSIKSIIQGNVPKVRWHVIELLEFVDARVMAAGFSYPFETVLLE